MQLALPISDLIVKNDALSMFPDIDVYQYRNRESFSYMKDKSRRGKTLLFHGSKGVVCCDFIDYFKKFAVDFWIEEFGLFSCNCAPACEEYSITKSPLGYEYYSPVGPILDKDELSDIIKGKLRLCKIDFDYFALENSNRYAMDAYENVCDPEFLSKMVRDNDIYFCLDIAHAITSYYTWFYQIYKSKGLLDFIFSYPLDRCIEIHLSKSGVTLERDYYDAHECPDDCEIDIFKEVVKEINRVRGDFLPLYVSVEYYKDLAKLRNVYNRLKEIIR